MARNATKRRREKWIEYSGKRKRLEKRQKFEPEDPEVYSCHFAGDLIEKNIPESLKGLTGILTRVPEKRIKEKQLRLTCGKIAKLISYEIRSDGCDIVDGKWGCDIDDVNIRKDFNSGRNVFMVVNCKTTYQSEEIEEFKRKFSNLYKIELEFYPL